MRFLVAVAAAAIAAAPSFAKDQFPDVIYVPTPHEVVDDMLRLANVHKGDVLYDLGSGDGRIAIAAAKKYGIKAVGIDIDPERIREATDNAKKAGVSHQFDMGTWKPEKRLESNGRTVYFWTIPKKK